MSMSSKLKLFFIELLAGLLRGLGSVRAHAAGFFRVLLSPFAVLGQLMFKFLILPAYRLLLVLQRLLAKILLPARNSALSLSAHRYIVHALVVVIVMTVSVFNVRSYTAHSETFGDGSVFVKLMHGATNSEEVTVEEIVDLSSVKSNSIAYGTEGAISATTSLSSLGPIPNEGETSESISASPITTTIPAVISAPIAAAPGKVSTYTVQDGDTLWDISKKVGIDVPTLLAVNDLGTRGLIRPGDVIRILPVSGVLHKVKSGENISTIAKKYAVESSDVLRANQMTEASTLKIGEELIIPGGSPVPVAKPVVTKPTVVAKVPTAAPVEKLFKEPVKPAATTATGAWVWPTVGKYVTQPFKGRTHTGIDVDGQIGTANYAAHDGLVEFAGWSVGYGLSIVINHGDGLWTRYGHNSQIYVKIGDEVKAGQTIALMGTTGTSTGSHLHFEVLSGPGKFLNPLKYVR